jgi:hypothetical protein
MDAITLQFVTCSDPASWPIGAFQRGCCSHAVIDNSGLLDGGGRRLAVRYYKERRYWDFLKAEIGKPFDKLAIVAFAVNRDSRIAGCVVRRRGGCG